MPLVTGGETRAVNLDYAASAPALVSVADHLAELLPLYASVHRGAGYASQVSTSTYENARRIVADHVGARPDDVVVFTRNTTDALGLLASAVPGETVLLDIEHHANLLPWQGRRSRIVASADTLAETLSRLEAELAARPAALVTVTGASNVTGEVLPLPEIATIAHRHGARLAVDGAQLVPHRLVDLQATGIDYLSFSGHKAYAPFGAGALVGRRDWLDAAPPYLAGGGAVSNVTVHGAQWHPTPARHEAGSPNVLGAATLARALQELGRLDPDEWSAHDAALREHLATGLAALPGVRVLRIFDDSTGAVGVVSFVIDGLPSGLVAAALSAEHGIGLRDGLFCAHPLLARLGIDAPALRASFGVGSTRADADALLAALGAIIATGPAWRYERAADGEWAPVDDARHRPEWASPHEASVRFGCVA
ncbi:aminotransferase class V-fold PLP-dependent enzyme [Rathayibacter sp. YIM 133350]|uniref:aminotransferase class V-fold PLP-dependent enzyme n=1 Tax=Rathayibacter sp. YIM 133350 TaxID=3131992 RepID=UPI00307D5D29